MERLTRHIETTSPHYFEQKFALSEIPSVNEIQEKLIPGQLLVAYYFGENNLYSMALTDSSFHIYSTPVSKLLMNNIFQFRRAVSDWEYVKNESNEAELNYLSSAHFLFNTLLKMPLEESGGKINSLVLVPDGILGYLSFDALLTRPINNWKSRNMPYLLKDYAISYVYGTQF